MSSGDPLIIKLLFTINAVIALAFTFGYKTKINTILVWFFLVSLHNRNIYVLNGGDVELRILMFFAMFLPLGARYSIDSKNNQNYSNKTISNPVTFCYTLQIALIYFVTAYLKTGDLWVKDFTAIYYTLSLDQFTTPLASLIYEKENLLKFGTIITLIVEKYGPLLFIIPFFSKHIKAFGIFLMISFHINLMLFMELGLFPFICIAAFIPLIPSYIFDYIENILKLPKKYYTNSKEKLKIQNILSYIIIVGIFSIIITDNIVNTYYEISKNKKSKEEKVEKIFRIPSKVRSVIRYTRTSQDWGMFAPNPTRADGFFKIKGRFNDKEFKDVFKINNPVEYNVKQPDNYYDHFPIPKNRWRKWMQRVREDKENILINQMSGSYCRRWKKHHKSELQTISVKYFSQVNLANYKKPKTKEINMWNHWCKKEYKKFFNKK